MIGSEAAAQIEETLARAERALDEGKPLTGTGFWAAVGAVRRDPDLVAQYADRIGEIDRRAFEQGVRLRVPLAVGNAALGAATLAAITAIVASRRTRGPLREPMLLGGMATLLVSTHSPAHLLTGALARIRFTHYFLGGPPPPRPGVKSDYATYLRASPGARAVMHASGAVVTKLIPFALVPTARRWGFPRRTTAALCLTGVVQICTDVALSTKSSDWKKVRREWRARAESRQGR